MNLKLRGSRSITVTDAVILLLMCSVLCTYSLLGNRETIEGNLEEPSASPRWLQGLRGPGVDCADRKSVV